MPRPQPERDAARTPPARKRPATLRERLERAARGLRHTSESDFAFQYFHLPAQGSAVELEGGRLRPEGFLALLGLPLDSLSAQGIRAAGLIEARPLNGFFPDAQRVADYYGAEPSDRRVIAATRRWRDLQTALERNLRGVTVLRVGAVEVRCYIAGLDRRGDVTGLVTTSIET
jgi:hypothetical protein